MRQRGIFEKLPGSGIWWIRYADQFGRIHREKIGPKKLALAAYHKRKTEVREGRFFPEKLKRREVGFPEIARDALEYSRANKAPNSYNPDRWHMEILLSWFRDRAAAEIMPQDIERKFAELAEQGRTPSTVNRYRALLSLIYSLAIRNGKVAVNPARLVRLRRENNARVRFLDEKEEAALRAKIRELHPDGEPEFDLALHTGMRRGEQYRLRWQDVDLKRNLITILRSKHGEARYIQINSVARSALLKLRQRGDAVGYVCPGLEGPRNRDWRRWFEGVIKETKIENFRWHDLRHTFASRLVMAGVDLRTVQELMGHKTIGMTVRYSHLAPTHLQEAVERLTAGSTSTATSTKPIWSETAQGAEVAQVQ